MCRLSMWKASLRVCGLWKACGEALASVQEEEPLQQKGGNGGKSPPECLGYKDSEVVIMQVPLRDEMVVMYEMTKHVKSLRPFNSPLGGPPTL